MAVDVKDLPPAYQAQALRKWAEQERKKKPLPLHCPADAGPGKPAKYHNKPTERVTASGKVIHFQSRKEARRYDELMVMLNAGKIRDLRLQVDFTLQEAYTDSEGNRVRAIRYRADFTYRKPPGEGSHAAYWADKSGAPWVLVVEDAKSRPTKTKTYAMKRKMMKEHYNIDIQEV